MEQLSLPIQYESRKMILGQIIASSSLLPRLHIPIDRLEGKFAGEEYVYLAHLQTPIAHARHYLGSAKDLEHRLKQHRRKYPTFRLNDSAMNDLKEELPENILEQLEALRGRTFRRHHTFIAALALHIGKDAAVQHQFLLMRHAKQHHGAPLLMAANRRGITWSVSNGWQANRHWESHLKKQKNLKRFCLACQGLPF